ncbi:hypothetical protein GF361_04165 [Candidatus Woesearchaeota archaeon]|nr:hypothetical protein [Candidatus Woesearchaeota archaeon]
MTKKTVIMGIDGAPYKLMKDLSDSGIMPNFKKIRERGSFKKLKSSIPEISSISWTSVITGKNPGEHGIFGFVDMIPNTYSLSFPNFMNIKEKPFWKKDDQRYIILNVPQTYPAEELKGVLISGFVALDMKKAVYPNVIIPKLEKFNYQIDVDSNKAHKNIDLFVEELFKVLDARIKTADFFWNEADWGTFMLVFTGSDRLMHFLWDAYKNENHKYHEYFLNYFRKIDEYIGKIDMDKYNLIMLSDHGFEKLNVEVNINTFLENEGFLVLDKEKKNYAMITKETKAFSLDPARIFLNIKGKYPNGNVEDTEKVVDDLKNSFESLEYNGKKVIKKIYKKEEIYHGNYIKNAPDLVLEANEGFDLKSKLNREKIFEKGMFTGKHNPEGFLFVNADENKIPKIPCVEDILKIMEELKNE